MKLQWAAHARILSWSSTSQYCSIDSMSTQPGWLWFTGLSAIRCTSAQNCTKLRESLTPALSWDLAVNCWLPHSGGRVATRRSHYPAWNSTKTTCPGSIRCISSRSWRRQHNSSTRLYYHAINTTRKYFLEFPAPRSTYNLGPCHTGKFFFLESDQKENFPVWRGP